MDVKHHAYSVNVPIVRTANTSESAAVSESVDSAGRTGKKLTAVNLAALGPEHHSFHSLFHQRPGFAVTVTGHGELLDFKSSDFSVTVGHGPTGYSRFKGRCSHRRLLAQLNQSGTNDPKAVTMM